VSSHTSKAELTGSVGHTFSYEQAGLFDLPPASRLTDPITSKIAGKSFERGDLSELHQRVLSAFKLVGPMTDEVLERLPAFSKYAPSTLRKRRHELYAIGKLIVHGLVTNSRGKPMTVWAVARGEA
jgi:hypothetical protein